MSKYTTEVRFICEMAAGLSESTGFNNVGQVIHSSHNSVIGDYPIFDEEYRETLNTKILKHYYTREICEETVGLWKLRLNSRMNEIMPYYNKLYKSELLNFNPFYDTDIISDHLRNEGTQGSSISKTNSETDINGNSQNNSTSSSENTTESSSNNDTHSSTNNTGVDGNYTYEYNKYSDTPQGGVTGVESGEYLTNARIIDQNNVKTGVGAVQADNFGTNNYNDKSNGNNTTITNAAEHSNSKSNGEKTDENTVNTTEQYLEHVHGKRGAESYSKLLQNYRETFMNIDLMVINELNDLFFGLWD